MSSTTIATRSTAHPPLLATTVATLVVSVFWTAFGADGWGELLTMAAVQVVAAGVVLGVVVPRLLRRQSTGGPSLAVGVVAVLLTLPAFWSGVPLVLGVAAAVLGNAGRTREVGERAALAGLALGLLAVLGYLALYLGDGVVAGHHGVLVAGLL
ncbi:hypothetical protein [Phycicoccus sp.]|uniref:hypothetical protein n=1 Tax=Phycicoccus sp. TaxID=1902410 RepID=UPI002D037B14|nr:hypothetical protein [Phycicoccus sp.]HMM97244.1 hypothetical protein [Phycicoccus sp.]